MDYGTSSIVGAFALYHRSGGRGVIFDVEQ